jgi:hypothetical protein
MPSYHRDFSVGGCFPQIQRFPTTRAKPAQNHRRQRPVHAVAHDLGQKSPGTANQRPDNGQDRLVQNETFRAQRPAGITVQQRDHHRHVRPSDGRRHVVPQSPRRTCGVRVREQRHREKDTERHREKDTERKTPRDTERKTPRKTD